MAKVKNCEDMANILAVALFTGDEEMAKALAEASFQKRVAISRSKNLDVSKDSKEIDELTKQSGHHLHLRAASADIQIMSIVQAKILKGEGRVKEAEAILGEAYRRMGGTIGGGIDLLNMVQNAKPSELDEIARLRGLKGNKADEVLEQINDQIAKFESSNYSIKQHADFVRDDMAKIKSKYRKKEWDDEKVEREIEKAYKKGLKDIMEGNNPTDVVKLDEEWAQIKRLYPVTSSMKGKTKEKMLKARAEAWSQYIMAREILADGGIDEDIFKAFKKSIKTKNLAKKLTIDQIMAYKKGDLDLLLARAYLNTKQLCEDGALRKAFRDKLVELTTGEDVSGQTSKRIQSIINTLKFSEEGASFATVLKYDNLANSVIDRGLTTQRKRGKKIYESIMKFCKELRENPNLLEEEIIIDGMKMQPVDVIQLIYEITGDKNIVALLNIGKYDDSIVLNVASQYLLGNNKAAQESILKLLAKGKKGSQITNTRNLILKSITGQDIEDGAKVAFYDFREGLYNKNKLNRRRADFREALANRNRLRIEGGGITNLSEIKDETLLAKALDEFEGGYLVVNDIAWRDNEVLRKAVKDKKITVIFPERGMTSNFTWEGKNLIFRTNDNKLFEKITGKISIQTLGGARPTEAIEEAGKKVKSGATEAGQEINVVREIGTIDDDIEAAAIKYYGEMLGETAPEKLDDEYVRRIKNMLAEHLGLDIKTFDAIKDKAELWQMIDEKFCMEKLTMGRYEMEIIDMGAEIKRIEDMAPEELIKEIKQHIGDYYSDEAMLEAGVFNQIREAYIDFRTAESPEAILMAKGRMMSLAAGGQAKRMTMDQIISMFQKGTMADVYKEMFFPTQDLTKEQLDILINSINDDLFDIICLQVENNLVKAGYSLPLMNIKGMVYDYIKTGNISTAGDFVRSFALKNNINDTVVGETLLQFMPKEIKFDYEDALYKGRDLTIESGQRSVFREAKNEFLEDSYSALATIEMAKSGDVPAGYEREILEKILDKYISRFSERLAAGGLDFREAAGIKQEASYALDMFEQDLVLARFGRLMSPSERQGLLGMKYELPIAVSGQNSSDVIKEMEKIKATLLDRYDRALKNVAENNKINATIAKGMDGKKSLKKKIELRKQKLKEDGMVIKEVNGQYLTFDSRTALLDQLNHLSPNIRGLESIKALGKSGLEQLPNEQVYAILRYVEAAKALESKANYVTTLMYKQSPELFDLQFFKSYKVVDGLPRIMHGNSLQNLDVLKDLSNTSVVDNTMKRQIFKKIKEEFGINGKLTEKKLKEIVKEVVDDNAQDILGTAKISAYKKKLATELMTLKYKRLFNPYTLLKDLPTQGGEGSIKKKVEDIIKKQYNEAILDLKNMGIDTLDSLENKISVITTSGEEKTLKEIGTESIDGWKKDVFDDETIFVKSADEIKDFDTSDGHWGILSRWRKDKAVKEQKAYREMIANEYDSTLQTMLNGSEDITSAERKLMSALWFDVRGKMKKYSLTNQIIETADVLGSLNEEIARGMKDYLIGFIGNASFGKLNSKAIIDRLKEVQTAYKKFYTLDTASLSRVKPTTKAEHLALNLTKYFKTMENSLGSFDGVTGCTTVADINKAFYHIGEVFMNLKGTEGVFSLLSAIEQNQILKFFKFAEKGDDAYVDIFKHGGLKEDGALGGYRDYVNEVSLTREQFNRIFGTAFDNRDYKEIMQALSGFTITGSWFGRRGQRILNFLNGSTWIGRLILSYPLQLLSIPLQGGAYFLKQIGFERRLGIDSLWDIDVVRDGLGIGNGSYNELLGIGKSLVSPDDLNLNSYYNRYGIPDVDRIYKGANFETAQDYLSMYANIDNYASSDVSSVSWWFRQLDPYKDNANNIIDGAFARNFKNIAFYKAMKENNFLQFGSVRELTDFLNNPEISAGIKDRLIKRLETDFAKNFRSILGLGFGGLDRPVAGNALGNIFIGLANLFNFRGSWGRNIAKQTGQSIMSTLKWIKMNPLSKEAKEAMADFLVKTPEFMNFIGDWFNGMLWSWKLIRYQDNGKWEDLDQPHSIMDFLEFLTDNFGEMAGMIFTNANLTSQWLQGIESYGIARPVIEMIGSMYLSSQNPTIYKDTWGVGALFNSIGKNFGRQWKTRNFIFKLLGVRRTDGAPGVEAFIQNELWKLSGGSIRYMVTEDMNSYGYTMEMTGEEGGGIPSLFLGEAPIGSDKTFMYELDNTEVRETIKLLFDDDLAWSDKKLYADNLTRGLVNSSQLLSAGYNSGKLWHGEDFTHPFTEGDLAGVLTKTEYGKEFYKKGLVTPKNSDDARTFYDQLTKNGQYRPGSESFNTSIENFNKTGHMDGKDGKEADKEMELWLNHMKYSTNEHGEYILKNGKKVEDKAWTMLMQDIKSHYYDQDYVTDLIYQYSQKWLDVHSSDPNYPLYIKMLGQGAAYRLIQDGLNREKEFFNIFGGKKANEKWDLNELKKAGYLDDLIFKVGNSKILGGDETYFERLQALDQDAAIDASLILAAQQVKDETDKKTLEKFFKIVEEDDGTGDKIKSIQFEKQYLAQLRQLGAMEIAKDEGNLERFIAEAANITNMFSNDDPTGVVTASLIDSIYERINSSNLSGAQKVEAMAALFHHNKDLIQRNPELMREYLGDDYDKYAKYMNTILYGWDGQLISTIDSMITSNDDDTKSTSGKGASLSSAFKSTGMKLGGNNYSQSVTTGSGEYKQWIPITIGGAELVRALGVKGYTPDVSKVKVNSYKPHVDFSIKKDVNRSVNGPKTQQISNKKQLSNLTKKTKKALEAEN